MEKTKIALRSMYEDDAPGLDGFPVMFDSIFGNIRITLNGCLMFIEFNINLQGIKCPIQTLITLIPKKENAKSIKDFWTH